MTRFIFVIFAFTLVACGSGKDDGSSGGFNGTFELKEVACSKGSFKEGVNVDMNQTFVNIKIEGNQWTLINRVDQCTTTTHSNILKVTSDTVTTKVATVECSENCPAEICQAGPARDDEPEYQIQYSLNGNTLKTTNLSGASDICQDPEAKDVAIWNRK